MSDSNSDVQSKSNALPPQSQTRSSSLRARTPRSSTTDRILHRTLPSRSPSLSANRRRRESSSQRNSGLRTSTPTSNTSKNSNTTTIRSPINNFRSNDKLNIDDGVEESVMICDAVDVQELSSGDQSVKENIIPSKYPFEIDKNYPIKQTTASGKKLANEVYELYEQQPNGTYRCTLCIDKIIKQNGRGTANLRSHLIFHGLKKYAFDSQEEQRILKSNEVSANLLPAARKHQIDQAILKCTIEAGLPFNLFSHDAIIELLNILEPGYKPPNRCTLSSRIHEQYYHHILDLKSVLSHVGPIAFTSDLWKDVSQQHIISLSLHTFSLDFEFISLPLSFHRFQEQKLASNLQAFFEHERERFGLGTRILAGITTDNGPDIKCAAASGVLGPRLACLAHCLNLVVHHATCLWHKPNPKRYLVFYLKKKN
ncbi:unnamed protein product [Rotaria sp. Silwood1]|nr:unnamed protein product [Rotaria sp. Silwood1]CAF3693345.1 unnamed protein product [Rotaria sp. Silwood1]